MKISLVLEIKNVPTISHINYWDQVNSWKNLWKFWNGPLCRNKSGPFPLLNVAVYWQSSDTKACAKKLSQILANNIDNGRRGIGLRIYVRYCSFIKTRLIEIRKHAETFLANKGYVLAVGCRFYSNFAVFKLAVFGKISNVICSKTRPWTPLHFMWKWITFFSNIFFHITWDKWQRFYSLRSGVSNMFFLRSRVQVKVQVLDNVKLFQ